MCASSNGPCWPVPSCPRYDVNRDTELQLLRTALTRLDNKQTDEHGVPSYGPVARYLDPAQNRDERSTVLRRLPLVVGFASQVATPGDFITHDAAGVPLIVVRAADDQLHAFVNACRHRGTRLLDAPCGQGARAFVCPYHAWTYNLDGALRSIPQESGFAGMDRATRNLVPLQVDIRFGLVFVVPTPGVRVAIDEFLRPFAADLHSWGFDQHVAHARTSQRHDCNWKLMVDGSFESYHVRHAHRRTIAHMFTNNIGIVCDWSEPHLRMVLSKKSLAGLSAVPEAEWSLRDHANILYGVFPNTILLVQPDHAMVVTIWPESVDRSRIEAGMLIPETPESDKARRYWDKNSTIFWNAIAEDFDMSERIHATLPSGANETLVFGRYEHLVPRWHATLDAHVARLLDDSGP